MLMEGGPTVLCVILEEICFHHNAVRAWFPKLAANGNCLRMFHLGKTDDFSNLFSSNVGLTRFQLCDTARTPRVPLVSELHIN
jgi:hypothetical protein